MLKKIVAIGSYMSRILNIVYAQMGHFSMIWFKLIISMFCDINLIRAHEI